MPGGAQGLAKCTAIEPGTLGRGRERPVMGWLVTIKAEEVRQMQIHAGATSRAKQLTEIIWEFFWI